MSANPLDGTALDAVANVADHLWTGVSVLASLLKWALVLGVAAVWVVFWGSVARLHFSMGDLFAAVVTTLLCVGPVLFVALGWAGEALRGDGIGVGPVSL